MVYSKIPHTITIIAYKPEQKDLADTIDINSSPKLHINCSPLAYGYFPENFPGKWRGGTSWSGYGSMVTNNVMLPHTTSTWAKLPVIYEYMSKWLSVTCDL